MISIIENADSNVYEIRFPYDADIVELVKQVPGRRWVPESKMWTVPKDRVGFFITRLRGTVYENNVIIQSSEDINMNHEVNSANVEDIDLSEVEKYVVDGGTLYRHQLDTLRFHISRIGMYGGFLLADHPGMGKTLSTLNVAMYMKNHQQCKHCLIIACVNSAKYNWVEDITKHTNGQEIPYILGTRVKRSGDIRYADSKEKLEDLMSLKKYGKDEDLPYFIVMNIEAIRHRVKKSYPIADALISLIKSGEIGLVALDEIHKNTSMSSLQGKQLLRIKKETGSAAQWIPITGTPITSKPTDLFLPLRLVDAHGSNSYYMWCKQYCMYGGFGNHDIVGYKNISQLKELLEPNMLRRRKEDALDLPPKIYFTEYIENSDFQNKLYAEIRDDLVTQRTAILSSMNPLAKLLRLRQVTGAPELVDTNISIDDSYLSKNAKMRKALDLIDDILSNPDEKVVVFSNWVEPLRTLYKFVKLKYKVCCYTGTMSQHDRELHKKTFIENPDYRVMIGTVGALGTSHTLTVASNIIFYDMPWNPNDKEQCEDRCHRHGTTSSVNIYTLITKETIDERVHDILEKKQGTAMYIVDNQLDLRNHPELLDTLLS